jgi:hypothetical protein
VRATRSHEAQAIAAGVETAPPSSTSAPAISPDVDPASVLVTSRRAGMYVLTDGTGRQVGTIRGDYVIGFTARYFGLTRWFTDLDHAKTAIAEEHSERLASASF